MMMTLMRPLVLVPLIDGISLGLMYILIALGLTLVFGFLGVINFAHGAYYMLGAYLAFSIANITGNFWIALGSVLVLSLVIGAVSELVLIRPTYHLDPITQLLITVGITFIIEGSIVFAYGEDPRSLSQPALFSGRVTLFDITYPSYRLFLIAIGVAAILSLWAFLEYTDIGLLVKASMNDEVMARALGGNIERTYTIVFSGSIMVTALAGVLVAPLRGINPEIGASVLLTAFIVVVMGGLGSFRGTVVAGLLVGLSEVIIGRYISFRLSGLVIFGLLLVVLLVRPQGLFGQEGVVE